MNKPSVLLLLQGWGLSASWHKNAIMSAGTPNFDKLWQNYDHKVLRPLSQSESLNRDAYYSPFFSNTPFSPTSEIIDRAFSNKEILRSDNLKKMFAHVLQHSSKLHLFLTISDQNRYGNINHLIEISRLAKTNGIFRVYIHLFLDTSTKKEVLLAQINQLEKGLSAANLGVATIHTLDSISNKNNLSDLFTSLVGGNGKRVLSSNQVFTLSDDEIIQNNYIVTSDPNFKLSDFDSALFCDHTSFPLFPLFETVQNTGLYRQHKIPKYFEAYSLVGRLNEKCIIPIFSSQMFDFGTESSIHDGVVLSDQPTLEIISSLARFPTSLKTQKLAKYDQSETGQLATQNFFDNLIYTIEKGHDHVIADLSSIYYASQSGQFSQVVQAVKQIDSFLPKLESCIIGVGGILNISSFYGLAEDLDSISLPGGEVPKLSSNPVPLITISDKSRHLTRGTFSLSDLISLRTDQNEIKRSFFTSQ